MRPAPNASATPNRSSLAPTSRCLAPTLGLLALGILACKPPACVAGETGPGTAGSQSALLAAKETQRARPIIALLQRLDRQIAEDHLVEPQNDNVSQTLGTITGLLEQAPAEDLQLVIDLPSHLAQRADQAAGSGRDAEARRFLLLAAIVSRSSPDDADGRTPTQIPQILTPGKDPVALAEPSPVLSPAQDAASLPLGESADVSQPSAPNVDDSSSMKEPPATGAALAALSDILDAPDQHSSKSTRGLLVAPSQLPTVFVTAPALHEVIAIQRPRVMVPPTTRAPVRVTTVNSRCRSIAQKFAIGEVPSEAERDYLREGCKGG
jgi:hypothetical protein